MALQIDGLHVAQADGGEPTVVAAGGAPCDSGVRFLSLRFRDAVHLRATPRQHLLCIQISGPMRFDCRIGDRSICHEPPPHSIAICPANVDCAANADGSMDAMIVAIDPGRFALAAAEESAPGARIMERFAEPDEALLELARTMASESAGGHPNGALFWDNVATDFLANLVARHATHPPGKLRGTLGHDVLRRIRQYVLAHLDGPIEVKALAAIAGRSPFHFTRLFAQAVGMTPHRYVVHLRLRRAVEMVRHGGASLAEAAACTGFADQSHLSRWVRRVYGVSPSQLAA
jgi:AraC family transcriptional regulator